PAKPPPAAGREDGSEGPLGGRPSGPLTGRSRWLEPRAGGPMTRPVCVVGATGATGTRVALLAAEAGLPVVLAGRNRAKLEVLASEVGGAEVRIVDLDRPATLDAALDGVGVIANRVGPAT